VALGFNPPVKTALGFLTLAAVVAAVLFGVDYYRHRFVRSNADLAQLLPPGDLTTFFVDFDMLRRAGMLDLLAGVKPADEKQYEEFVSQTQFHYLSDMSALAGASDGDQLFFAIRGRFDWNKLKQYTLAHGGVCQHDYCTAPTSRPGRWANFLPIQPDVIGLAVSPNGTAADLLRPPGRRLQEQSPDNPLHQPVWVKPSRKLMKTPADVPLAVRIFAITLQSAESVTLSLEGASGSVAVRLSAGFANEATAEAARNQMEIQTKMLKLQLAREQQRLSPADLMGLLTSGTFQVLHQRVIGVWPVRQELLRALQ
jgi:hypothetical protein